MIDGSVLQSAQKCFEKKSRVVVKMVVTTLYSKVKLERKGLIFCTDKVLIRPKPSPLGGGTS